MRYLFPIILGACGLTACGGANNGNLSPNRAPNTNVQNVNVSHPESSPQTAPANAALANGTTGNHAFNGPGMANEKVLTPAPSPDKRVPPINRAAGPELKGTPLKKP
jgi:hypothetical protein